MVETGAAANDENSGLVMRVSGLCPSCHENVTFPVPVSAPSVDRSLLSCLTDVDAQASERLSESLCVFHVWAFTSLKYKCL